MRCRWIFASLPGIVAALVCGCSPGESGPLAHGSTEAERGTYEEHAHHVAEHRPASFPDAVERLRRRHKHLRGHLGDPPDEHVRSEFTELLDIVDWLPELAANSDLGKAEWDGVNAAAKQLRTLYARLDPDRTEKADPADVLPGIEQLLRQLTTIAEEHHDLFDHHSQVRQHEHHEHHQDHH